MNVVKNTFLFFVFLCFSCNDSVQLKKEDVIKHDWIKPFVIEINNELEGIHNIDSGIMKFDYYVKNSKGIIFKLDNIALVEKWNIKRINDSSRVYTKDIQIYGEYFKETNILVTYIRTENKLYFEIK
ncbi:hypothetical protein [Flavobacterium sp.]|uniref:hypothetical protein n=1 Tax=Flavobacterium sp. TaxID=239 RepID=UPI003341775A